LPLHLILQFAAKAVGFAANNLPEYMMHNTGRSPAKLLRYFFFLDAFFFVAFFFFAFFFAIIFATSFRLIKGFLFCIQFNIVILIYY
jgi:hypothetical protein